MRRLERGSEAVSQLGLEENRMAFQESVRDARQAVPEEVKGLVVIAKNGRGSRCTSEPKYRGHVVERSFSK